MSVTAQYAARFWKYDALNLYLYDYRKAASGGEGIVMDFRDWEPKPDKVEVYEKMILLFYTGNAPKTKLCAVLDLQRNVLQKGIDVTGMSVDVAGEYILVYPSDFGQEEADNGEAILRVYNMEGLVAERTVPVSRYFKISMQEGIIILYSERDDKTYYQYLTAELQMLF